MNICCENNTLSVSLKPHTFTAANGYVEPSQNPEELLKEEISEDDE
jgi:hypothetical protein